MGWFSALIERRSPGTWTLLAVVAAIATATVLLVAVQAAFASHPEVSLAGSNFEIDTDANLRVDDPAPSLDWANVNEVRKADTASGPTDESFGQGTKEDTAVPSVVDGSIPPNKSDLKFFGVYQEGNTSTGFLNLFWSRVQDPTGTTNMDFELNQSSQLSANGVTPVRTVGDLLIIYDLSQGGTRPTLSIRRWTGSAWGPATNLTSDGKATGSINTSPIPADESDGLGAHSARTFGEAQVALSALFPNPNVCTSFGSAYLKSRSSDSFTAALKDFVPPTAVNISNCGGVKIIKQDDTGNNLAGAEFTLYKDNDPTGGSRGAEDTITTHTCTTGGDGTCTINNVIAGEYWVVETKTPAGHDSAADQHATVTADSTVTLTFVDPRQRGAIVINKTAKHAGAGSPDLVAGFTIKDSTGAVVATPTTDSSGKACVDGLLFGTYSVSETTVPTGYAGDPDTESAVVDSKASCPSGTQVSFENTPLTNITVSAQSQVTGGTASKISCTSLTADPADTTPDAFDDTSETFTNLTPGTYNCTVVVDP